MKGSIEEKMRDFQNNKAAIGKGIEKELTPAEEKAAKIPMMLDLFGIKATGSGREIRDEWD
jgi:hypothetical protein